MASRFECSLFGTSVGLPRDIFVVGDRPSHHTVESGKCTEEYSGAHGHRVATGEGSLGDWDSGVRLCTGLPGLLSGRERLVGPRWRFAWLAKDTRVLDFPFCPLCERSIHDLPSVW